MDVWEGHEQKKREERNDAGWKLLKIIKRKTEN
jgi:hypothetical protein